MEKKINRRRFLNQIGSSTVGLMTLLSYCNTKGVNRRPNILFAISDDQSWLHTGINGCRAVDTPAFDRVANEGVLFTNAFCAAPQCSPNRAAILTGRHIWQLEEAGTHASNFPIKFEVFPDLLEKAGYQVGYTAKGWSPGNWEISGRKRNPAGPNYDTHKLADRPIEGIRNVDYATNFKEFFQNRDHNKPFCFWFGCSEPHRRYEKGSGVKSGKKLEQVTVPSFLPDVPEIKSDILDYLVEIEWFDSHLGQMLEILEQSGELDNTVIIVTSDNGMPFPRAKANLYEYGTHVPLAIRWSEKVPAGRVVDDLISFVDFAPTFLEIAGLEPHPQMTGKSFWDILMSSQSGRIDLSRQYILSGRERHSHSRPDNLGYPSRAIRSYEFLYIRNFKPERWPAGNPSGSGDPQGYHDIDGSPSKTFMLQHQHDPDIEPLFRLAFAKRPAEELYDLEKDVGCLKNLADDPDFQYIKQDLTDKLNNALTEQGDPRVLGYGDIFESYPRYSRMRKFNGFKKRGEYNPAFQVK